MTDPTPPSLPSYAPGWYPDATMPGNDRYYDGSAWTNEVRPATPVGPTTATAGPAAPGKKPQNAVGTAALAVSLVGLVFACIPGALIVGWVLLPVAFILGIVALFQKDKPKWQGLTAVAVAIVGTIIGVVVFVSVAAGAISNAIDESATEEVGAAEVANPTPTNQEPASEAPASASAEDLVLGETAFGIDPESGMGWYAIELTNPNEDHIFSSVAIDVEAYDADNVLLDTDTSYGVILSGSSFYVGDFLNIGSAKIDRIEVRGPTADAATHSPAGETGNFTVSGIETGSEFDHLNVKGTLTSNFSVDQEMVRVDVIARKEGKIIGVDYTYTDRVPAGGTVAWTVDYWNVPRDAEVQAYPHL